MEPDVGRRSGNRRGSLAQVAYERIRDDILDEQMFPRQPLIETELAAKYGMSKTPIREALLSLAREGLVEMSSFRGGRVRDFTANDACEIYEVRELLEPFALRRAVPRLEDGDRRALRVLLDEAKVAAFGGDWRELSKLNRAFHGPLVAQCGNRRVIEILVRLQDQVMVMSLRLWNVQATHLQEPEQHKTVSIPSSAARKAGSSPASANHLCFSPKVAQSEMSSQSLGELLEANIAKNGR
jgi:DNA-binding GntR family transcriptional regulator